MVHAVPRLTETLAQVLRDLCIVFHYQNSHDHQYITPIMIETGQKAPDFTLNDSEGRPVALSQYRGSTVVVYFYPKDDTPGCTKEACSFRDNWPAIVARGGGAGGEAAAGGIVVLGISADDEASHRAFAEKYDLPFTLLSDPETKVIRQWGAWGTKNMYGKVFEGILRYTYIVDGEGVVRKVFKKVKTDEHAREVLDAITELGL
ncbi:MAG: thioredoxin-dependent thiol peroxidase [Spirochaetaceae bacterium]|nr:MAG: thioredoxin-dependent thiol peroxidase [Spirochaetaceae bacterium]